VDVSLVSGPTTGSEGSLEHSLPLADGLFTVIPDLIRPIHPWHDTMAWWCLTRLFRRQRPEIVHTHSGKAGFLGRLAARQARVPVIIHTIHGPSFGPFQGQLANAILRCAERRAGRLTTHFVSVADAMTRQYLSAGIGRPDQFTRIFSGFDLAPFRSARNDPELRNRLGIDRDDLVVGKIARLFKLKGHEDLFAIAPQLIREFPRLKFLLIGDGPWRGRFEAMAAAPDLAGHVIFAGLVPPGAVPEYVGITDVVVHLSLREGLARALPQALAAAKPVVAYDCDGAAEVCRDGETGFLVKPGHHSQLIDRLRQLINNPELRSRFGDRGREQVRELFPVNRMVDQLLALYQQLIAEHGGTRPR
jgi:glycosyltransferase involved in cell wall biosynthesis